MKIKLIVAVMLFAGISLAQTSNPPTPDSSAPQSAATENQTKPSCPCCAKMADSKTAESCCAHHDEAMKSEMSCSKGKDGEKAMACMKDKACSGEECGKDQKSCCQQAKMSCCNAKHEHDDMAHGHCAMMSGNDHGDMTK